MGLTVSKKSRAAPSASLPDFCGPLRTGELRIVLGGKSYVKHFYSLKGRRLTQTASVRSVKPLAIFDIKGVRVDSVDPKLNRRGLLKKRRDIELVSDGVTWLWLRAPDEAQQRQWLKALRKAAARTSEKNAIRANLETFDRRLDASQSLSQSLSSLSPAPTGRTTSGARVASAARDETAYDAVDEDDYDAIETVRVEDLARASLGVAEAVALELLRAHAWDFAALRREWHASDPAGDAVLAQAQLTGVERFATERRDGDVDAVVAQWDALVAAASGGTVDDTSTVVVSSGAFVGEQRAAAAEEEEEEEECPICYADDVALLTLPECGHGCCAECWRQAARVAVDSGAPRVACQRSGCRSAVRREHVAALLPAAQRDAMRRFRVARLVQANPLARWCPNPRGCDKVVRRPRIERDESSVATPRGAGSAALALGGVDVRCACALEFCFACASEPHGPASCTQRDLWLEMAEVARGRKKRGRNSGRPLQHVDAAWFESNTKPCPRCKMPIQKNDGCNHMTCTPPGGCGHEFCWMCLGPWSEHGNGTGGFYQCNVFDESKANAALDDLRGETLTSVRSSRAAFYQARYHDQVDSARWCERLVQYYRDDLKSAATAASDAELVGALATLASGACAVVQARRVLSWSFAFAFFVEEGIHFDLFAGVQYMLCHRAEQLHELVQTPHNMLRRLFGSTSSRGEVRGSDKKALVATLREMRPALERQGVRVVAAMKATREMEARLLQTTREMRASGVAPDPAPTEAAVGVEAEAEAEAEETSAVAAGEAETSVEGGEVPPLPSPDASAAEESAAAAGGLLSLSALLGVALLGTPRQRATTPSPSTPVVEDATSPSAWACVLCGEWNARVDSHCVQCNTPVISGSLRRKLEQVEGADATRARPKAVARRTSARRTLQPTPRSLGLGRAINFMGFGRGGGDGEEQGGGAEETEAEATMRVLAELSGVGAVRDNRLRYRLEDDPSMWACPVCTLHNEMMSVACVVCGQRP